MNIISGQAILRDLANLQIREDMTLKKLDYIHMRICFDHAAALPSDG